MITDTDAPRFRVINAIVCDDVRTEDNGKDILIGVYNDIQIPNFPVQLILAFWVQMEVKISGKVRFNFRLTGEHGEKFFNAGAMADITNPGVSAMSLTGIIVPLQIPTSMTLSFKEEGGEWATIREFSVKQQSEDSRPKQDEPA